MSSTTITCPKCRQSFELTEAMAAPIEARLRSQFEADKARAAADLAAKEKAVAAREAAAAKAQESVDEAVNAKLAGERAKLTQELRKKVETDMAAEVQAAREENAELRRKADAATKKEVELARRERELTDKQSAMELELQAKLSAERVKIAEDARKQAAAAQQTELTALKEQLATQTAAAKKAQDEELKLRQERAKLEEDTRTLKLQVQRTLDEERAKIREDAARQADESHRLTVAEKDQKIAEMVKQIDDLRRKADSGSQQAQGEVLEVELERLLRDAFPLDLIEPVGKGVFGGDVVQRVRNDLGQVCGTILWESKRTKNWQSDYLTKLRDDGRAAKADACALMTTAMPKNIATFGHVEGIWVTNRACVVGVAAALRQGIMQVADAKRAMQGQQGKMELVYHYLTGPQFRQRVEAIVESFSTMQKDLDAERRAMEKLWAKREKQIERAALNAMGMHGDLAGIVGKALPELDGVGVSELLGAENI